MQKRVLPQAKNGQPRKRPASVARRSRVATNIVVHPGPLSREQIKGYRHLLNVLDKQQKAADEVSPAERQAAEADWESFKRSMNANRAGQRKVYLG